jgi:hypothetical protein
MSHPYPFTVPSVPLVLENIIANKKETIIAQDRRLRVAGGMT